MLFSLSVALDALWVVASMLSNLINTRSLESIDEETIFKITQSYSLVFTARWFKRFLRSEILPLQIICEVIA